MGVMMTRYVGKSDMQNVYYLSIICLTVSKSDWLACMFSVITDITQQDCFPLISSSVTAESLVPGGRTSLPGSLPGSHPGTMGRDTKTGTATTLTGAAAGTDNFWHRWQL